MKMIKKLVDCIEEELEGAQNYAEKYVEYKANGNTKWSGRFKSMAEDELQHSNLIHELAVEEISKLRSVYEPSQEMLDKWDKAHTKYVEKAAWIKQMLAL
ncbi:MAG: hypothetical protein MJ168_12255 [Clostridia bacterium]|nr:hypothetical protein [Clostridia bacterium]